MAHIHQEGALKSKTDVIDHITGFFTKCGWNVSDESSYANSCQLGKNINLHVASKYGISVMICNADQNNDAVGKLFKPFEWMTVMQKVVITGCADFNNTLPLWFKQQDMLENQNGDTLGIGISAPFNVNAGTTQPYMYADSFDTTDGTLDTHTITFAIVENREENESPGMGKVYNTVTKKDIKYEKYVQTFGIFLVCNSNTRKSICFMITGNMRADEVPQLKFIDPNGDYVEIDEGAIEGVYKPIYSNATNSATFALMNIDGSRDRGTPWACTSSINSADYTGKHFATSLSAPGYGNMMPKTPKYSYIQAKNNLDFGRNVSTLNCITLALPIAVYVLRDPDELENYSQFCYIEGLYFISLKNLAPCKKYEIGTPRSGVMQIVYPAFKRGSLCGYDGIAVARPSDEDMNIV